MKPQRFCWGLVYLKYQDNNAHRNPTLILLEEPKQEVNHMMEIEVANILISNM